MMYSRKLYSSTVELEQGEKSALEKDIAKYKTETDDELKEWRDQADEVSGFVRGAHFADQRNDDDTDPEELGGRDRMYPSIPYLPSRIDKMVQAVRYDEWSPEVFADQKANFDGATDEQWLAMRAEVGQYLPPESSDNEVAAAVLTARLKRAEEKGDFDELFDEVLEVAAQERTACVLVGYDYQAELGEEPAFFEVLRPRDFGYDPKAKEIWRGRWAYFIERGVKRSDAEKAYGFKLADIAKQDAELKDSYDEESVPEKAKTVDVFHWFVCNNETVDVPIIDTVEMQAVDEAGQPLFDESGMPVVEPVEQQAVDEDGQPLFEQVLKYRGGWQYVVTVCNKVVSNGQSPMPNGKPPLIEYAHRRMPRKVMGLSMYDLARDFNKGMDRLLQYGLESTYKAQPKTLAKKSLINNWDDLLENTPSGIVEVDVDGSLSDAFMHLQGGGPSSAVYESFDRLIALADQFTGVEGIDLQDIGGGKLSGDAIEGAAQDRDGVMGRSRRRFQKFRREVFCQLLSLIVAYEDAETVLTITGHDGIDNMVAVNVGALRFDDQPFEATYDVRVTGPQNMPRNPIKRGQYLLQVIQTISAMMQTDPEAARLWVQVSGIPMQQTILKYIDARIKKTQSAQPGGPTPEMQKAMIEQTQARQDAELKVRQRIAESVSDSLERMATEIADTNPAMAMQIIESIPLKVAQAFQFAPVQAPGVGQPTPGQPVTPPNSPGIDTMQGNLA